MNVSLLVHLSGDGSLSDLIVKIKINLIVIIGTLFENSLPVTKGQLLLVFAQYRNGLAL